MVATPDAERAAADLLEHVLHQLRESGARVPSATYRLQFSAGFGFDEARRALDHLAALGVSDVYASPLLTARQGSTHGYDIVSHASVSEELGGTEAFERYVARLHELGLGHVLDFVPNHMGVGSDNPWWLDVLENGPSSVHAKYFDIDWAPLKAELAHKVLLPILGDPYGQVLERGELQVRYEAGGFSVHYFEHCLPLNPRTYPHVLEPMLPGLIARFGEDDEPVLELQSILTGLRHLPPRTELRRAKVVERRREKEILKRRLSTLVDEVPEVEAALEASLAVLNGRPGDPRSFDALDRLLEDQAWRPSYWRVAAEEINYRRFFDVNDLAALRMDRREVFEEAHRYVLELYRRGAVTGFRIDHPDGLRDPGRYFRWLQRGCFLALCRRALAETRPELSEDELDREEARLHPVLEALWDRETEGAPRSVLARPAYVVAEKILSRGETLPDWWPVHGTTGYDFATAVGALLTDPAGEEPLTKLYERFIGTSLRFDQLAYKARKLVLGTSLASELNVLAWRLDRLSEMDRHTRDFTLQSLLDALREVLACFPVYRTYVTEDAERIEERDRLAVLRAVRLATQRNPAVDASIFRFVRDVLQLEGSRGRTPEYEKELREFVLGFQQLSGPVMAKGLEDTAFYVFNRLVSLNEVGGEPERFGLDVESFHRINADRHKHWPHAMLALSTHDTKRSADVRARIGVLSELPDEWAGTLSAVSAAMAPLRGEVDGAVAPDPNEEYLLYQTVLGALPFEGPGGPAHDEWVERLVTYMRKATKEAKVHTSWVNATPEYDAAVEAFVRAALGRESPLWKPLAPLFEDVAFHGVFASLSQLLLQLASPGVPDLYQGSEIWDFSLVDPDNRRPVDFDALSRLARRMAEEPGPASELVRSAFDGRIKLHVVQRALEIRRAHPALFGPASTYDPLHASGERAAHVVAFAREVEGSAVVAVAPRWTARLAGGRREAPLGDLWGDTKLGVPRGRYTDAMTGARHVSDGSVRMRELLAECPVALLVRES